MILFCTTVAVSVRDGGSTEQRAVHNMKYDVVLVLLAKVIPPPDNH